LLETDCDCLGVGGTFGNVGVGGANAGLGAGAQAMSYGGIGSGGVAGSGAASNAGNAGIVSKIGVSGGGASGTSAFVSGGGASGTNAFVSGGGASGASAFVSGGTAGIGILHSTLGHAGSAGSVGRSITPILVASPFAMDAHCPIDKTLPACNSGDQGAAVARDDQCMLASADAHGCPFFSWALGSEWVFFCSSFSGCQWPLDVNSIIEYSDYVSIHYTTTEPCQSCDAVIPSCVALLIPTTKRVSVTGDSVKMTCAVQ
jgi:hypothetical protein